MQPVSLPEVCVPANGCLSLTSYYPLQSELISEELLDSSTRLAHRLQFRVSYIGFMRFLCSEIVLKSSLCISCLWNKGRTLEELAVFQANTPSKYSEEMD